MSKTLRTAALVVGAVALVATGVGAAAGAGLIGTAAGSAAAAGGALTSAAIAATAATVGSYATLAALGTGLAMAATAKKPSTSVQGNQTAFTANMNQGMPYVMGRTSVSGFIVHRQTHGTDNLYQTFFAVLSAAGPIHSIEAFKVDGVATSFTSAGAAQGDYAGWMWLRTQLGQTPEPAALASPVGAVAGWDGASKMSGYAGYAWTLKFDSKGKKFSSGVPEPSAVVYGVKAYDPRQDSTYPGGSGAQRLGDESTWTVTDNAFLHGLTWLIGRRQNGKRVMGVGAPIDGIDVAAYVEACNIALANGWKMGGVVYSTDEKWAALKAILQAGGGEPTRIGARISCTINAPRVSLDTIRSSDLAGDASAAATQSRRDRINAVVPRYRSEAHGWEMVAAKQVVVPAYVAEDGGQRTKEIEFPLVQDAALAAQLAAYEVVNAREFGPITLPLRPRWIGYKPGDCLTIDIPELNMVGQTALVISRSIDPSTGVVTLTLKSETAAKHDFALGRTANPPPTPSLQVIDPAQLLIPGVTAVWDDVRDPNLTKPENSATVGGVLGKNIRNADGSLYVPTGGSFDPSDIYAAQDAIEADLATTRASLAGTVLALALTQAQVTETATQIKLRPNLQTNGGFGQGMAGLGSLPPSAAIAQNNGIWGTYLQHTQNGSTAITMPPTKVVPGLVRTVSFDSTLQASAGTIYVDVVFWSGENATGTPTYPGIGASRAASFDFTDGVRQQFSYTVPAGCASTQLRLATSNVTGIQIAAFRRIKQENGPLPASQWSDDATVNSVDASIRQVDTARANDTAASAVRFVAVESRVTSTENVANSAYAGYTTTASTLASFTGSQSSFNSAVVARFNAVEGVANGAAAGVTGNSNAIAGLNASLASYKQEVSGRFGTNEGNITTALTGAANAQSSVATLNQTLSSRINGNPNLLPNGGLRQGTAGLGFGQPVSVYDDGNWGRIIEANNTGETIIEFPAVNYASGEMTMSYDAAFNADAGASKVEVACYSGFNRTGSILGYREGAVRFPSSDFSNGRRDEFTFLPPTGTQSLVTRLVARNVSNPRRVAWRRVQLERRSAPASVFSDDATDNSIAASVMIQAGTLSDLQNKNRAFFQVTAQVPGQRTQLTISADSGGSGGVDIVGDVRITGDLIVGGTVRYGAMRLADFTAVGSDTDGASYLNQTPGSYLQATGLVAVIPGVGASGTIQIKFAAGITLTNAGAGSTSVYDSYIVLKLEDAAGHAQYENFGGSASGYQSFDRTIDNLGLSGNVTITAYLYHGNTNLSSGEAGVPGQRSVHIQASNFTVNARWRWI